MQFQLRQLSLQAQQQPSISRSRVIDAISISDQTASIATDIQQGIPIRAITRKARDIDGENNAHLAKRDSGYQPLKTNAMRGTRSRHSQIGINHLDVLSSPAQVQRSLLQ